MTANISYCSFDSIAWWYKSQFETVLQYVKNEEIIYREIKIAAPPIFRRGILLQQGIKNQFLLL